LCTSTCANSSLLNPFYAPGGSLGPLYVGLTTINTLITSFAAGMYTGSTCTGFASCGAVCGSASMASLSAATAVGVTVVAASLTQ